MGNRTAVVTAVLACLAALLTVSSPSLQLPVLLSSCRQALSWPLSVHIPQQLHPAQPNSTQLPAFLHPVPQEEGSCGCESRSVDAAACQLSGPVSGCCQACDYASVERVNRDAVNPLLTDLVQKPFFRYFKVNLWCDCPMWPDDAMCSLKDCSVCECEPQEVPKLWTDADTQAAVACTKSTTELESAVDRTVSSGEEKRLLHVRGWRGFNNPWHPEEDDEDLAYSYINLLRNPERYTGYKGERPREIWQAIYSQSCFNGIENDTCPERRILYRLISGMHASISAHLANDYLLDEATGAWGRSLPEFQRRLGNPGVKAHVENLYFAYLFVLRAVLKAGPLLSGVAYDTGALQEDQATSALMAELVNSAALKKACPVPFHEGQLWKGEDAEQLRQQLQVNFHNITRIMDCVGCEKCKLWGKLQLLGVATSLKILFTTDDCDILTGQPPLVLERNEVIALINLLERLSKAIEIVRQMSLMLLDGEQAPQQLGAIQNVTEAHVIA